MMGPLQQHGLKFERPPYYHPPRSRPVAFERPANYRGLLSSTATTGREHKYAGCDKHRANQEYSPNVFGNERQQQARANMSHQMANLPSYNSVPEPFVRRQEQQDNYYTNRQANSSSGPQQAVAPKILINDQSYPTSTVHKSMLNIGSNQSLPSMEGTGSSIVNYARSPSTISPEQVANNAEVVVGRQQQHLGEGESNSAPYCGWPERGVVSVQQQHKQPQPSFLPRHHHDHHQDRLQRHANSNTVLPDTKSEEYMLNRQLERVSIAHQTYRTLPIIMPKPKARHDLASGTYMRYVQDPSWELARLASSRAKERKFEQAVRMECDCGLQQQQQHYATGSMRQSQEPLAVPAFNYREYIDSTRRAY